MAGRALMQPSSVGGSGSGTLEKSGAGSGLVVALTLGKAT